MSSISRSLLLSPSLPGTLRVSADESRSREGERAREQHLFHISFPLTSTLSRSSPSHLEPTWQVIVIREKQQESMLCSSVYRECVPVTHPSLSFDAHTHSQVQGKLGCRSSGYRELCTLQCNLICSTADRSSTPHEACTQTHARCRSHARLPDTAATAAAAAESRLCGKGPSLPPLPASRARDLACMCLCTLASQSRQQLESRREIWSGERGCL